MASMRYSPETAKQVHRVYDQNGAFIGAGSNKSAASRWINKQAKAGIDTKDWTMKPYTSADAKAGTI